MANVWLHSPSIFWQFSEWLKRLNSYKQDLKAKINSFLSWLYLLFLTFPFLVFFFPFCSFPPFPSLALYFSFILLPFPFCLFYLFPLFSFFFFFFLLILALFPFSSFTFAIAKDKSNLGGEVVGSLSLAAMIIKEEKFPARTHTVIDEGC